MEPSFDEREREALNDYMRRGGWVTEFTVTREFEKAIALYTGARFCSVLSNGTVSLVAALLACGLAAGDEVIVPDYTMVASANAVELIGAKTVFADIERQSLGLDFEAAARAVTDRTRAVMLVAINGRCPRDLEKIMNFCRSRNLRLIEDAAQALGSRWQGRHLGTLGDVGSFSFSAPKIITTGQGGALVTDDAEMIERLRQIRDFGRAQSGRDHYLRLGWNFKFTDLQAVVGLEQMKKLPWRVERKKEMGRLYDRLLAGIPGLDLIPTDYGQTVPWFFDVLCDRRDELKAYLQERNIGSREFYPALHREPAYGRPGSFPVAEEIARRGLWLPSSINLSDGQIAQICEAVRRFYSG